MPAQPSTNGIVPSIQRSAATAFAPLQREFNRIFDELSTGWDNVTELRLAPSMDVADTKDGVEITVEVPGMTREDINIAVEGDMLTISGEKKAETETKDRNLRVVERSYGQFSRSVYLPTIETSKIEAKLADGVLKIRAPKKADAQAKTIQIQSA